MSQLVGMWLDLLWLVTFTLFWKCGSPRLGKPEGTAWKVRMVWLGRHGEIVKDEWLLSGWHFEWPTHYQISHSEPNLDQTHTRVANNFSTIHDPFPKNRTNIQHNLCQIWVIRSTGWPGCPPHAELLKPLEPCGIPMSGSTLHAFQDSQLFWCENGSTLW